MKFNVTAEVDWIDGYLRYGHLEGVIEADSIEHLKEMMKEPGFRYVLDLVVDSYSVEHYGGVGEYKIEVMEE